MPVHRHLHDRMGSVYASRAELDAWTRKRNLPPAQETHHNGLETTAPAASAQPPNRNLRTRWTFVLPLAVVAALAMAPALWLQRTEHFWRSPIADAHFQTVSDFDGLEQGAAVSRDGHLIAFLSNRDGQTDVWLTQAGSGAFHNLTHGSIEELANPLIRTPGFSPDGSLVTFWVRKPGGSGGDEIGVWAVPTLGGEPRPYLEGVAEFDWSRDGAARLPHAGPGDPLFVSNGSLANVPIYTAPAGQHSHFPTWAPDGAFIYFVQGELPDKLDIWRIRPAGGTPERITSHMGHVSHPVLLDRRTLMYLATDPDGSGPWLYSMDVERRIPHRLSSGPDRYTSLAATPTVAAWWRLLPARGEHFGACGFPRRHNDPRQASAPTQISLTTGTGFSPRLGADYLLYVSANGPARVSGSSPTEPPRSCGVGQGAQILGAPAIAPDGQNIAFSVRQGGKTLLYVMHADGSNARMVTDSLDLQGAPAWTPDGQSITVAASDHGVPTCFACR